MPVAAPVTLPDIPAVTDEDAALHTSDAASAELGAQTIRTMGVPSIETHPTEILSTVSPILGAATQILSVAHQPAGPVERREVREAPSTSIEVREVSSTSIAPPPRRWKRAAVIGATGLVIAAVAFAGLLWPASPRKNAAPAHPVVAQAKLHITVDEPATISVDGVVQPPGSSVEVQVTASEPHEVKVTSATNDSRVIHVPALDPGSVQPVHVRLGGSAPGTNPPGN